MERQTVQDIKADSEVMTTLMVKQKRLSSFKEKPGYFLTLVLGDATGEVETKLWDDAEAWYSRLKIGQVIRVKGMGTSYQGRVQIRVEEVELLEEGQYDLGDFLPRSPFDLASMEKCLEETIGSLGNPYLRELLARFFSDPEFRQAFFQAPAAKKHHQAYLSGLLEHTLNVVRITEALAQIYPQADRDLLVAGAILHDVGKIKEYCYSQAIDLTPEGRLIGHIVLGVEMLDERVAQVIGFPPELHLKLRHLIVSHHGEYEWQSPRRPMFLEAMLLHRADLIDADAFKFNSLQGEGMVYSEELGRHVYLSGPEEK